MKTKLCLDRLLIFAVCIAYLLSFSGCFPATSMALEAKCREKLVALGTAEEGYRTQNRSYGYFSDLQSAKLIDAGKTVENFVPGYKLTIFLDEAKNKFAIIAAPSQDPAMTMYMLDASQMVVKLMPKDVSDPGRIWTAVQTAESDAYSEDGHYIFPEIPEYRDPAISLELLLSDHGIGFFLSNPADIGNAQKVNDLGPDIIFFAPDLKYFQAEPL